MQVNMLDAKNQLSKLVKAACEGEEVIIANHGKPVVRLVKLNDSLPNRGYGAWKHLAPPADDWDSVETNAAIARSILYRPIEPAELAPAGSSLRSKANPEVERGHGKRK